MNDLLDTYNNLLQIYTEQVQKFEKIKNEDLNKHLIQWIPFSLLNSRIFVYDEYLQNPYYGGVGYEEKKKIMPNLVRFIVTYENSSEETVKKFEKQKTTNEYQNHLDEIIPKIPFLDYLKGLLRELQEQQYQYSIPFPPKRSNATRQLAKYKEDMVKYQDKIASLNRCRDEINERIKFVEEIKNQLK